MDLILKYIVPYTTLLFTAAGGYWRLNSKVKELERENERTKEDIAEVKQDQTRNKQKLEEKLDKIIDMQQKQTLVLERHIAYHRGKEDNE